MNNRLLLLKDSLELLSSDYKSQINYLISKGFLKEIDEVSDGGNIDEIALEFEDQFSAIFYLFEDGIISRDTFYGIKSLGDSIEKFSGKEFSNLWTARALKNESIWGEIRRDSSRCLFLLRKDIANIDDINLTD